MGKKGPVKAPTRNTKKKNEENDKKRQLQGGENNQNEEIQQPKQKKRKNEYEEDQKQEQTEEVSIMPKTTQQVNIHVYDPSESFIDEKDRNGRFSKIKKPPEMMIPIFLEVDGNLKNLYNRIAMQESDIKFYYLVDNPGFGKTTFPRVLAWKYDLLYVRLVVQDWVTTAIVKEIIHRVKKINEEITAENLSTMMIQLFKNWLLQLCTFAVARFNANPVNNRETKNGMLNDFKLDKSQLSDDVDKIKIKTDKYIIFHIDEITLWSTNDYTFDGTEKIPPNQFEERVMQYLIRSLSRAFSPFDDKVRFFLTGTNLKLGNTLRYHSSSKYESIELPSLNSEMIYVIVSELFDLKNIRQKDFMEQIANKLVGPPRLLEYFLVKLYEDVKDKQIDQVTIRNLEIQRDVAIEKWKRELGQAYSARYLKQEIFDQLLLVSVYFPPHPTNPDIVVLAIDKLPDEWIPYVDAGFVRIDQTEKNKFHMWKPYPVLAGFWEETMTIFHVRDVETMLSILRTGEMIPTTGKGYCFQVAVALELRMMVGKFWVKICSEVSKQHKFQISPHLLNKDPKINLFSKNEELRDSGVNMAQDKLGSLKKWGDIVVDADDSNNTKWKLIFEAKNADDQRYLTAGLADYFMNYLNYNEKTPTIFIYLSWAKLNFDVKQTLKIRFQELKNKTNTAVKEAAKNNEKPKFKGLEKKFYNFNDKGLLFAQINAMRLNQKAFLVVDGLSDNDFSVKIQKLRLPDPTITMEELRALLPRHREVGGPPLSVGPPPTKKIWVKYEQQQTQVDISDCPYVDDLQAKCCKTANLKIPQNKAIVIKLGGEKLSSVTELDSIDLRSITVQAPLQVEIDEQR